MRAASTAERQELAVAIKQPRWTCFRGVIARRGGWAALRVSGGSACPGLPYAIVVRADDWLGWREVARFWTRRGACAAARPRLPAVLRAAFYDCPAPRRR